MSMNIIGQQRCLFYIDKLLNSSFPKSCIIKGPIGSGRHLIANYIYQRLKVDNLVDIDKDFCNNKNLKNKSYSTDDLRIFIDSLYDDIYTRCVIIDADKITYKEEPVLLKFLEEPPEKVFIILIASKNPIQTILNRCVVIELDKYRKEELYCFLKSDEYKKFIQQDFFNLNAPGKVLKLQEYDTQTLDEYQVMAGKIFVEIINASYSNVLTIPTRFNFKEEKKFDFDLFVSFLFKEFEQFYVNLQDAKFQEAYYKCYLKLMHMYTEMSDKQWMNPQSLFENFLFNIKDILKECQRNVNSGS